MNYVLVETHNFIHPQHTRIEDHAKTMGEDHPDADLHPEATGLAAQVVKVWYWPCGSTIIGTDVYRLTKPNTH